MAGPAGKGDEAMTLPEAEKKFALPLKTLEDYVAFGFIRKVENADNVPLYADEDFERLGLIQTLLSAGFTPEETRRYLSLSEGTGTVEEQVRMLRKRRGILLSDIHRQQQLLDKIDFMIWNKKKLEGEVSG